MGAHSSIDTNTQVQPYHASDDDPVQSFSTSRSLGEVIPDSQPDVPMDNAGEDRLECECGVNVSANGLFPSIQR